MRRFATLSFKIRLAGLLLAVAAIVLVLIVLRSVLLPSFLLLEQQAVTGHLDALQANIDNELATLDTMVHDWAARDDTYRFVQDRNQAYLESNLQLGTFRDNRLTLVALIDAQGVTVYARAVDLASAAELPAADFLADAGLRVALGKLQAPEDKVAGLVPTPRGVMLVAARSIVDSQDQGPVRGAVVFGRLLDEPLRQRLRQLAAVDFRLWSVADRLPEVSGAVRQELLAGKNEVQVPVTAERLWGFRLLHDLRGAPLEILGAPFPRDIYRLGRKTVWIALFIGGFGTLLLGSVAAYWMNAYIFKPLNELTGHVRRVEETRDLSAYLPPRRDDEIGRLVKAFNALVARVKSLMAGTWQEISERRQVEEGLRESETRYRALSLEFQTLLHGIPDGLLLLGRDGRIIWANQGALRQLHGQRQFLKFDDAGGLVGEYFTIRSDSPVARCFVTGSVVEGLEKLPDGRMLGVKAFPLRDEENDDIKVIRLATDITDKLKFREESARTARLASLGELSAGIAHEINNPNGIVLMNLPILQRGSRDLLPLLDELRVTHGEARVGGLSLNRFLDELLPLQQEVYESAQRIQRIVDDLKDFVRVDGSRLRKPVDLNDIVEAAIRLTANTIKRSTARFNFEPEPRLPLVLADFQQIEQVIVNLIQNACQALTDPQQAVTVRLAWMPEAGVCRVQVEDEGRGIPPEARPHVFDPFFTTRREAGGTGLGLSVSMRIIRDHDGHFDFDSTPGEGTVFIVELPAATEKET